MRRALTDHKLFALPDESRYYFGHKNRLISLLVLFQNDIKKCFAALINIPICHIEALGIPRIGDITAARSVVHQLMYLSRRIAAENTEHIADVGAVHADEQIVFVIVVLLHCTARLPSQDSPCFSSSAFAGG